SETSQLQWNVPKGNWRIFRFGYHVIGDTGSVDILNKDAVTDYFHRMCSQVLKDNGPLSGKTLTHFYNVSWEGSNPDWTDGFETVFAEKRKYDIRPYLPILSGLILNDLDHSKRFLQDFYKTVADSFREHSYANIGRLCHERGILWHSEDGGPWRRTAPIFRQADMLSFWGQNDIAQGEFWVNPTNHETRSNMRACAMASHIYGHNDVACESFTHMNRHWSMYPAWLKPAADVNFIDGMNMIIWHTFTASPPEKGKPGFEYFAGTHVNTNVTWWNDVGPFLSYIGRCQYLLRQGKPVTDVCVYVSDVNYVGWGRLERWNKDSKLVLPKGYSYDLLDTNVLANNLEYENGRLSLPHGMSYRILVVDLLEQTIPIEAMEKILKLARDGATVVLGQLKPSSVPGLTDYPKADQRLTNTVNTLWGTEPRQGCFPLGKGKVCIGMTMEEVLASEKIVPDFTGPFEYNHRTEGARDIFFVTGEGREECLFRVADRQPLIWNPQTGKIEPVIAWRRVSGEQTAITLDLPKNGSTFVVFAGSPEKDHRSSLSGPDSTIDTAFSATGNIDTFWQDGTWKSTSAAGKTRSLTVKVRKPFELAGPWNVAFDPAWGGPAKTVFEKLTPWNENEQPGIKFYSGTAVYSKSFQLDSNQISGPIRLCLGKVDHIARVKLNGCDLGVVWTDPWTVDLTGKVVQGENRLEIAVTNCWTNRLIGDAALPPEKRLTKTNIILEAKQNQLRRFQGYWGTDTLQSSGLTGPVRIEFGQTIESSK
ncbi:MAG: glycosyl hydrolase, partial [Planctomycetia bacterium]|nr:glycosyl hydrolase [Planctomycetia bacterium]